MLELDPTYSEASFRSCVTAGAPWGSGGPYQAKTYTKHTGWRGNDLCLFTAETLLAGVITVGTRHVRLP